MWPPGPVLPSTSHGVSYLSHSFLTMLGRPPVLLDLVVVIHLVQRAQHNSHPHSKELEKQHPLSTPARSRLVIYFFEVIRPIMSWFNSLGNSTLGKQKMKCHVLMKSIHCCNLQATARMHLPRNTFWVGRHFSLCLPLRVVLTAVELSLNCAISMKGQLEFCFQNWSLTSTNMSSTCLQPMPGVYRSSF